MSLAKKNSFRRVGETCPKVRPAILAAIEGAKVDVEINAYDYKSMADAAFDEALSLGTEPLRDALIDCEQELLDMEERACDAEGERDAANATINDLREELGLLLKERDEAESALREMKKNSPQVVEA